MQFRRLNLSAYSSNTPPPNAPAPARAPRTGKRLWRRILVRLILFGSLGLGALLFYLILFPWSAAVVDRQIKAQWKKATGLSLEFDKAQIYLLRGWVEVINPRLLDPGSGQPLLKLRRVRIMAPAGQFFSRKRPYLIKSIDLDGAVGLTCKRQNGRLEPQFPLDRILAVSREWRAKQALRRPAGGEMPVVLQHVRLDSLSVRGLQPESLAGGNQKPFEFNNLSIDMDFGGTLQPRQVIVAGQFNGTDAAHAVHLSVQPDLAARLASFSLRLEQFDSLRDMPTPCPVEFHGAGILVNGRIAWQPEGRWTVRGQSNISRMELIGGDSLPDQNLGAVRLAWELALDPRRQHLELLRASLASEPCSFETSGTLETREPFPYQLSVKPLKLQGQGLALLAGGLGRSSDLVRPGEASVRLEAQLAGTLRQRRPESVLGRVRVAGLNLHAESYPPLNNLQLDAELTSRTLRVKEASGSVQGIPVELSGQIDGHLLAGKITRVEVNWKSRGRLSTLSSIIDEQMRNRRIPAQITGDMVGEGRVRLNEPADGDIQAVLGRMKIDGQINLTNVQVQHASLPGPIRKLNGKLIFTTRKVELKDATGEFMGSKVTVGGDIEGAALFWRQPRFNLTGQTRLDLTNALRLAGTLSPDVKDRLARLPKVTGLADLTVRLAAEVGQWEKAHYEGSLVLKDVQTNLEYAQCHGPLTLGAAELSLDPTHLTIKSLAGRLGDIQFQIQGRAQPDGLKATVVLDGALRELKERVPAALMIFEVDGQARVDSALEITPREGFTPPGDWLAWATYLKKNPPATADAWMRWIGKRWQVDSDGTLNLRDGELTFVTMPARLRHITGQAHFDTTRLWMSESVAVQGGELSRNTIGQVELIYGKTLNEFLRGEARKRPTTFRFRVTGEYLNLDEWIKPWKVGKMPFHHGEKEDPYGYDPTVLPVFQMRGEFATRSASFHGVLGQDYRTNLDLDAFAEKSNLLRWYNIGAKVYGGTLRIEGRRVKHELDSTFWLEKVKIPPLMQALSGKPRPSGVFSGVLTGNMTLHRGNDDLEPPPLLEGTGQMRVENSRFVSNAIFHSLGGVLKLPIFEDITFSTIHGPIELRGKQVRSEALIFDNPILNLKMSGSYGPDKKLDLNTQLQFLQFVNRVPLVGEALGIINKLAGKILRVQIRGTIDNPRASPL